MNTLLSDMLSVSLPVLCVLILGAMGVYSIALGK